MYERRVLHNRDRDAKIVELWVLPRKEKRKTLESDPRRFHRQKQIKELEFVTKRYEENLGEPLRAVKEDVEKGNSKAELE